MPESWAGFFFFPSSSSWANKSSDLPLCIISRACLGALPRMGGAPKFQLFLGNTHHHHLGQSVSSHSLSWDWAVSVPPKTTLQVDFANQLHVQVVSPRVLVQARTPK